MMRPYVKIEPKQAKVPNGAKHLGATKLRFCGHALRLFLVAIVDNRH
jgi:hypothetical protein